MYSSAEEGSKAPTRQRDRIRRFDKDPSQVLGRCKSLRCRPDRDSLELPIGFVAVELTVDGCGTGVNP
jgi:hypothetical protein